MAGKRGWPKGRKFSAAHKRAISRAMLARSSHTSARNKVARARQGVKTWGNKVVVHQKVRVLAVQRFTPGGKRHLVMRTNLHPVTRREIMEKGALLGATVALGGIAGGTTRAGTYLAAQAGLSAASGTYGYRNTKMFLKRPGRVIKIRTII